METTCTKGHNIGGKYYVSLAFNNADDPDMITDKLKKGELSDYTLEMFFKNLDTRVPMSKNYTRDELGQIMKEVLTLPLGDEIDRYLHMAKQQGTNTNNWMSWFVA